MAIAAAPNLPDLLADAGDGTLTVAGGMECGATT
jgi:hypothetical protein